MPILNLSKEQYNTFLNSNSLDDFINLRSSIEINDELVSIPKNYIAIRTLSADEYNKYIIEGTADGSIIANNVEVWQYKTKPLTCFGSYNSYSDPASFWNTSHFDEKYPKPGQDGFIGQYSNDDFTMNIPVYGIILMNNIAKQAQYYCCPNEYLLATANYSPSMNYYWVSKYISPLVTIYSANKDYTNDFSTGTHSINNRMPGYSGGVTVTVNLLAYSSFVPVFQYVDNNKSTNIHY